MPDTFSLDVLRAAHDSIRGVIERTPCERARSLSQELSAEVFLKLENLQVTGSFKARGAGNRLLALSAEERARGVIAASAGNHAQGVAFWAKRLGIQATIVMPVGTPLVKVSRTAEHGANVVLCGENYDDAFEEASRRAAEHNFAYIHAYDDEKVIQGQASVGFEIAEQVNALDVMLIPVGGGGLIAGAACVLKQLNPKLRMIGVEASVLPSMKEALKAKHPVKLPAARTLAEGIAVRLAGERCLPIVARYVDDIVTVDDDAIARAILFLLEREKTVAEGAGAAAVAALLARKVDVTGLRVCAMVCGGNIDVNVLSRIIERGLVETGRLARLKVLIPDRPGALKDMLDVAARLRCNVVEVHHERAFSRGDLGSVQVELVTEMRGHDHVRELEDALVAGGFRVEADRRVEK